MRHVRKYRILEITVRYGLPFRMRCGCSGQRQECERFRRIERLTGWISPLLHWLSQYPWHTGRVSTPGSLAESVPLAHGPDQVPGTRAESVPPPWLTGRVSSLAHWPSQCPWHTGRVSAPGTQAESVPPGRVSAQPTTVETFTQLGSRACRYPRHLELLW